MIRNNHYITKQDNIVVIIHDRCSDCAVLVAVTVLIQKHTNVNHIV